MAHTKRDGRGLPRWWGMGLVVLAVISAIIWKGTSARPPKDPTIARLARVVDLPKGEARIEVIEDPTPYRKRQTAFFQNVQQGDKVIMYDTMSILFRPTTKKIIAMHAGPPVIELRQPLRLSFRYNGNGRARAQELKAQLEQSSSIYEIVELAESLASYSGDLIYLINTARAEDVVTLSQVLGGSEVIQDLEANETTPSADVIVSFRDIP